MAGGLVARTTGLRAAASGFLLALLPAACAGDGSDSVSTVTATTTVTEATTVTETTTVTVAPDLATRTFRLPSGNIGCLLAAGTLRCDILSGLDPEPAEACEFDWVGLVLGVTGAASPNCGSDTVYDRRAPTLEYGSTWARGGIVCESSENGLACVNREGHELTLARGSWSVS